VTQGRDYFKASRLLVQDDVLAHKYMMLSSHCKIDFRYPAVLRPERADLRENDTEVLHPRLTFIRRGHYAATFPRVFNYSSWAGS
jgi:hypothetical protein